MNTELHVLLDGQHAGTITRLRGGKLRFRYDDDYRGVPLSVSMPTQLTEHTDRVIAPWIAGLLPDNEAVIARWSRRFHTASSPFALLGTPIGEDCAGAVQFAPPERVDDLLARSGHIAWLTEAEVADRLRILGDDATAWLGSGASSHGQFSLAGAQAKVALFFDGERWGSPSGASPTSHILKPTIAGLEDHDVNEHLCLAAAHLAGLIAARTSVECFGDQSAIVVERYDRIELDGALRRIHQEDLCQALSVFPDRKYQSDGGPGARRVIALLRAVISPSQAALAVSRFTDALIWNWLLAGTDAHAKNYSLLLAGGQVRFAPLYDIASALPYGDDERSLRFAMKIGRDYGVFAHDDPWPRAAKDWGVDADRLRARALELADRIVEAFSQAAADSSAATLDSPLPALLIDQIAQRVARCRRVMNPSAPRRTASGR